MRYSITATYAPNFTVEWSAPDATKLWVGMPSSNHKGTMPLSKQELSVFRDLERRNQLQQRTERYLFVRGV